MIDLKNLEIDVTKEIYKESFYEFYKDAFCQLHPEDPYDENWHAEYLCGVLQKEFERIRIHKKPREKDIIINMPFRASKSMITTVIFPVWCWSQDARTKFICVSYSEPLALEHAQLSKDLIYSQWFRRYYEDKVELRHDSRGKEFYKNTAGGFRKSVGAGGAVTGSGCDLIICDDLINPKKASSEVERQTSINFYNHTLYSRLNSMDVGVRIIVMQRLHEQDITGYLLDNDPERESINHICIPAYIETEKDRSMVSPPELLKYYKDGLFWNTRFNWSVIKDFNKKLGELQAAGQLQQRPAPAEGNLLKRDWFEIVEASDVMRNMTSEPIDFFLDTSYTEKQENDPNGFLACFKRDNILYITNAHEIYAEFPKLVEFTKKYVSDQGYSGGSRIFVEPKASGKSLVQYLRYSTNLNTIEIEGDFLKDDKKTRASAISPICQAGRIKLIKGEWNDKFLDQITMFPNAAHDEFIDDLCYAINIKIPTDEFFWGFM